ncbi:MAG TPA: RDD family protein [Vicinamibacterales bacterium]|nr:RDD family protein [Vicinamibacterales bacterium]
MKCPKCGYLGYERVERCRNCGYDFSLGSAAPTPELRLRDSGTIPQPLDDLELLDAAAVPRSRDRFDDLVPERIQPGDQQNGVTELPLFGPPITDDVPLITKASPPRPPLSVRRSTPEVPRLRAETRAPLLEWSDPAPTPPAAGRAFGADREPTSPRQRPILRRQVEAAGAEPAGIGARAVASLIDVALLALVDAAVIYFTMKICRLTTAELALLPKAPLVTFLLLQNGGYFVAFTATGQTLGKMIAGVRVLADDSEHAPDLGRAALRAAVWMVLALPIGLGLLAASLSRDRRGLHDRFAGTRVVRAGA